MSRDFVEILSALSAAGARFLIVGAHALAGHGTPRATGHLDVWMPALRVREFNFSSSSDAV